MENKLINTQQLFEDGDIIIKNAIHLVNSIKKENRDRLISDGEIKLISLRLQRDSDAKKMHQYPFWFELTNWDQKNRYHQEKIILRQNYIESRKKYKLHYDKQRYIRTKILKSITNLQTNKTYRDRYN